MESNVEAFNATGCNLAADLVRTHGSLRLRVAGGSMAPAVRPGDTILVQSCGMGEVSAGEIVVFMRNGRLVVHRAQASVALSGESHLLTCGDRIRKLDARVTGAELLGRVTCIERNGIAISPVARRSLAQKLISRALSYSNRATSLYLRVASR